MNKTFNIATPFNFLLQAIAKLSLADKQRLWEFLDIDLHDSADDISKFNQVATVVSLVYF